MSYLLPPFSSTYHEFTHRNLQVAKRQEDTVGGAECGGVAKCQSQIFEDGLSKFHFFAANLHLEERKAMQHVLDPPPNALLFEAHSAPVQPEQRVKIRATTLRTVDGQNPAPPIMMIIPLFIGF